MRSAVLHSSDMMSGLHVHDSMLDSQSSCVSESGRSTEYVIQDEGTSDSDGVQTSSL